MNHTRKIFLLFLCCLATAAAQMDQPNVLSYYAVGNSLDGQLMSGVPNVLRFFPVYAMQQQVDSVRVTVYYGGKIFIRYADRAIEGSYWEALLPQFRLGEAIQRLEVEEKITLGDKLQQRFPQIYFLKKQIQSKKDSLDNILICLWSEFVKVKSFDPETKVEFGKAIILSNGQFENIGIKSKDADQLRKHLNNYEEYISLRDSLIAVSPSRIITTQLVDTLTRRRLRLWVSYTGNFEQYLSHKYSTIRTIDSIKQIQAQLEKTLILTCDSIQTIITEQVETHLIDTLYSGPSVRKSDVVIDEDCQGAHLLYRNYKPSLRYMPALDPAERMGIFRVRYVPFPIVGTADRPRATLLKPMSPNSPTVFEVGLAFGDAIVPGDDFVPPEFSWKRLGVAFAITEQLFSEDARIIGLALTYDFNSYGSVGVGGNFAQNEVHGYFSFGINKKAFEEVVKGLVKLFH